MSKASTALRVPLAAGHSRVAQLRPERERVVDLGAAENALVAGRQGLRDRRSGAHHVDDDRERSGGRLRRRERDVTAHLGTTLRHVSEPMRCYRHPNRETYISCTVCDRPICTECMTPAPVGQRCPEHSGKPQGVRRVATGTRRAAFEGTGALVTKALIGLNVLIYVLTCVQGSGINSPGGSLYAKWVLFGPAVANGDWWRLITSAFLHANLLHIAFNMYFLWFVGSAVETALGRGRFLAST